MSLGLTGYEARVYLALIGRDRATAAQAARDSGVPRQRIYDVLAGLTRRGLVRSLEGRVIAYSAVDPAAAIERLMASHRADFSRLEQATVEMVEALVPVWSQGRELTEPLEYVEVIRDKDALAERFEELLAGADSEILSVAKFPYLVVKNPANVETARRLVARGGTVRALYERTALDDLELVAEIQGFVEAGEQVRIAETVPMRMCVVDGTHVLMSLRDPVPGEASTTNLLIEHPALAQCLTYAFDAIWAEADPFEDVAPAVPDLSAAHVPSEVTR